MKESLQRHVISSAAFLVEKSPKGYLPDPSSQYNILSSKNGSPTCKQGRVGSVISRMNKLGEKADSLRNGVREHVRLAPKITETLKGKLSLGAKILKVGGVEKVFKQLFSVREGEKLLKASQCYLSTTSGPIAGLLFISTDKVAFCSEKAIKFSCPNGEFIRIYYKVLIPVRKIKTVNQSENVKKPSQKYIDIVTTDNFEFWFMGFIDYQRAFKYLQQAIPQA
ncbi:GEM-like protein 4 [Fagus crenata]